MGSLEIAGILGLVLYAVLQVVIFAWLRARLPDVLIEQLIYPWVLQKRYWRLEPRLKRAGMTVAVVASMVALYGGGLCLVYEGWLRVKN